MGPWPLFYYHTSFSSGTKCGISFMDVDPVLKKMWKPNKGHSYNSFGPLAPILLPHTFSSGTIKCFMEVGPETFKIFNKMWSHGITEFRNDGRTWQIQYSPTFSKRGYKNTSFSFPIDFSDHKGLIPKIWPKSFGNFNLACLSFWAVIFRRLLFRL